MDDPVSERTIIKGLAKAFNVSQARTRSAARWVGRNVGGSRVLREELRHIFPDHWSFFFGEIALYCFLILIVTGVFMALFFSASSAEVVYNGSYEPLKGVVMSDAYRSTVNLSLDVRAGLLVRQVHHWAALVFAAALGLHLFRMFFTGAYRRPRMINWMVGLILFVLVVLNGIFGYSLPDDLLSGTGLRIAYSITESIPLVGPWLASLMFGGAFPSEALIPRIYPVHIFLVPGAIGGLLGVHLGVLWLQRHTQFAGPGRDERTVLGTPPRSRVRAAHRRLLAHRRRGARRARRLLPDQPGVGVRPLQALGRDHAGSARLVHRLARGVRAPLPVVGHRHRRLQAAGAVLAGRGPAGPRPHAPSRLAPDRTHRHG